MAVQKPANRSRGLLVGVAVVGLACVVGFQLWSRRREPAASDRAAERARRGAAPGLVGASDERSAREAAVEGVVLDPDGRPVDGAAVAALRQPERDEVITSMAGWSPHSTRSAGHGRFRIEGLRPGRYTVAATSSGLTGAFLGGVRVAPGETTRGLELRLRRDGVTLSGRVLDAGGGPIPGARVRATYIPGSPVDPSSFPESAAFETVADAAGAYRIQLPKGRQNVTAQADGYAPAREFFELTADTSKDFRLEPAARITGRVVTGDERSPVPGAEVNADTAERRFDVFAEPVTTDEQGVFRFTTLTAGSYRLSARKGGLIGALAQPVSVTVAAPAESIELALAAGLTVDGTVKSRAGKPIAGAHVSIFPDRPMGGPARPYPGKTDEAGRFTIEGLQPGRYRANVSADGHASANVELKLEASISREFVLEDGVRLEGVVLTAAGQPAAGAEVQAMFRSLERNGMGTMDRATTDAQGRFQLERLIPGEGTLTVRLGTEAATHGPETLAAGEHKQVTIRLAAGARVSGTITWDDGSVAPRIKIVGTARGGGMLRVETESAADGSFTVGPFAPGEIAVVAMPPGERIGWSSNPRPEQADLKVSAGEHRTGVELVASRRNGTIKGMVVGPGGKPIDGAAVLAGLERDGRAWRGSPGEGRTTSNMDGTFVIDGLTKGTYTLWASHPAFAEGERTGVAPGASDVKLALRAAGAISGVAVDARGKPITAYTLAVLAVKPGESERARLMRAGGFDGAPLQVNDARGQFSAQRVAPGTYDLVATAPDGRVARTSGVTLSDGESKTGVRLVAESGLTVTGRVIEYDSGQPLAGVLVRARAPNGQGPEGTTDATGAFTVENVPRLPTMYVTFEPARRTHVPESAPVPVTAQGTADLGTIKLIKADPKNPNRGRIGISYTERDGMIVVGDVTADSPGAKAGVRKGDILVDIEGHKPTDLMEASRLMRTEPDKAITVTVQTPGQQPRTVALKRSL